MRILSGSLIFLLAAALVLTSGCTEAQRGPSATAGPVSPLPSGVPDLKALALSPAELPACFSLSDERVKSPDDVSDLAKNAGWEAGYEAVYTCPSAGSGPTVIVHSLAVYPAVNVLNIAGMVDRQDRPQGYVFENISDPDQSFYVSGFSARFNASAVPAASSGSFLVAGGKNISAPASDSAGDFAEFIVFRKNVFEVLKMTGPGTNATLLHELARTAAQKIP
ncbi:MULTISPECIES: hypothetical protein [unclassified Methanoregula]|uniref:hypothetical protein n=1 Tax=unclassified Methanoregula TaxID=2649730 RepID=UPI0025D1D778|nr:MULTISPECIES: hypothetical protein [unclassified Methanoregula]